MKLAPISKPLTKSYAQALKPVNYTKEVIKIKDTFLSLRASKINQVQKIIKGRAKPKPCIQMTTKSPSRKQVIIPINRDNIMKFMKKSSLHISNINRALRNIKFNVSVNFIRLDLLSITIITCKVASLSNLQVIENYIKSVNYIDAMDVKFSCLLQSKSYLKIIGISYFQENSMNPLTLKVIKDIIKQN